MKNVKLLSDIVGDGFPCYFIAEIGNLFRDSRNSSPPDDIVQVITCV